MLSRSRILIVLFAILLSHSIIAQDTTEEQTTTTTTTTTTGPPETTTTRGTPCNGRDEFPLFNDNTCITRTAYTAIFLTSIILAGISFLMLIGLIILLCSRRLSADGNDIESSVSRGSARNTPSMNGGRNGQYTSVVQNMAGATPLDEQKNPGSSAPYSPATPVTKVVTRTKATTQQANGDTSVTESYEMTARQTSSASKNLARTQPSSTPKTTDLDDRPVKGRARKPTTADETETSYF